MTIAALCTPELLKWQDMPVQVLLRGPFEGFMVPRMIGGAMIRAAIGVQVKDVREWVIHRLV